MPRRGRRGGQGVARRPHEGALLGNHQPRRRSGGGEFHRFDRRPTNGRQRHALALAERAAACRTAVAVAAGVLGAISATGGATGGDRERKRLLPAAAAAEAWRVADPQPRAGEFASRLASRRLAAQARVPHRRGGGANGGQHEQRFVKPGSQGGARSGFAWGAATGSPCESLSRRVCRGKRVLGRWLVDPRRPVIFRTLPGAGCRKEADWRQPSA